LTFGLIIVRIGAENFFTWPAFAWLMLFSFVYTRVLTLLFASLVIAPEKMSFSIDPWPNRTGVWKILSVGSFVVVLIIGLGGFLWKRLPIEGLMVLAGIMFLAGSILLVNGVQAILGKNGPLRQEEESEPVSPPDQ